MNVLKLLFAVSVQALHLFKKAEVLLETMNKELDKSRVMSNRPPRGVALQRTASMSPGMPQTPGPSLVPVSRVRHARYVLKRLVVSCSDACMPAVLLSSNWQNKLGQAPNTVSCLHQSCKLNRKWCAFVLGLTACTAQR